MFLILFHLFSSIESYFFLDSIAQLLDQYSRVVVVAVVVRVRVRVRVVVLQAIQMVVKKVKNISCHKLYATHRVK